MIVGPAEQQRLVAELRAAGCVFAEDEARLLLEAAGTPSGLALLVERRVHGEPLEQVLGWVAFDGLRLDVVPGVFVPRRRTELLVGEAVEAVRAAAAAHGDRVVVLDQCTGVGAVAAAVAVRCADLAGRLEVHAADVDPVAVACARANLARLAPGAEVHEGDLLDALPARLRGTVDVLAASPPYVPSGAVALMPPEARDHEPRRALDGGGDGLDVARRIVAALPRWLRPGGTAALDLGEDQAPAAADLLAGAGLVTRVVADDELGATVVAGTSRR